MNRENNATFSVLKCFSLTEINFCGIFCSNPCPMFGEHYNLKDIQRIFHLRPQDEQKHRGIYE